MQSPTITTGPGGGQASIKLYGISAEFETPEEIIAAADRVVAAGYRHIDAYTPFPVHGLAEKMEFKDPRLQWTIFFAGLTGAVAGLGMQAWTSVVDYPMNVGGRPLFSWPSFIPVMFECTILFAAFGAVFGMLAFNGLPKPYHPVFNADRFELASQNRFFMVVEATDPQFDPVETRRFLESLGATHVGEIEDDSEGNY
jgi:hypothetical protein